MWFYTLITLVIIWLLRESFKSREPIEKEILTDIEQFCLNLGNLEYERLSQRCKKLDLHDCLEQQWGVRFDNEFAKDRIIYTLQKILTQGTVGLLLKEKNQKVRVKDMIAFDSSCFVELVRQAMALKLLSKEEGWGLLFLNGQRVQDTFEGWKDFKSSYFRGAEIVYKNHTNSKIKDNSYKQSQVEMKWLDEDIFSHFKIESKD